jgi:septum formation protein
VKRHLLLGSESSSRQMLLRQAQIPFKLLSQRADETVCDWGLSLEQVVTNIALYKMEHLIMPSGNAGQIEYVLTADTLSMDKQGRLSGKPINKGEAVNMIKRARDGMRTATSFCLEKKEWNGEQWICAGQILECIEAIYVFDVPDNCIDHYFKHSSGFVSSGSIAIEGYGGQFLKKIDGSYSAIIGLPLYEVRRALEKIGFFS